MENLKEMTPIELNVLIIKIKEEHEKIKSNVRTLLDEIDSKGDEINVNLEILDKVEERYVQLMGVLMEKQ